MEGALVKQAFKDRIINRFLQMSRKDKQIFLHMLKFKTDEIAQIISGDLSSQGLIFAVSKDGALMIDHKRDSQELLKELQEHFAKEMVLITR
jgi:hypothetical protein